MQAEEPVTRREAICLQACVVCCCASILPADAVAGVDLYATPQPALPWNLSCGATEHAAVLLPEVPEAHPFQQLCVLAQPTPSSSLQTRKLLSKQALVLSLLAWCSILTSRQH